MINKTLILICVFFLYNSVNGQTISGFIKDQNNEILSYVNVGILGKSAGTVSDGSGAFSFEYDAKENTKDTLRFSMIGYETKDLLLADFASGTTVNLNETVYDLPDAEVSAKAFKKEKLLGNPPKPKGAFYTYQDDSYGGEIGQYVKNRKGEVWLKEAQFYVHESSFDSVVFRLKIYDLTKNKMPENQLLPENVIQTFKADNGIVKFDISDLNILIDTDFMLALECINTYGEVTEISKSLTFGGGIWSGPSYYKETSQSDWLNLKAEVPFFVNPGLGIGVIVKY